MYKIIGDFDLSLKARSNRPERFGESPTTMHCEDATIDYRALLEAVFTR